MNLCSWSLEIKIEAFWDKNEVLEETMNMQWKNKKPEKKRIQNRSFLEKWNTSQTCPPNVGDYLFSPLLLLVTKIPNATDLNPKCEKTKKKQHWRRLRNTKKFKLWQRKQAHEHVFMEFEDKNQSFCFAKKEQYSTTIK